MTKVIIDGTEIDVAPELTLLQACEQAGAEIPRFCFHERLSIAGNCRMCLIEVKGGPPKPVASCAQNVRDLRPGPNDTTVFSVTLYSDPRSANWAARQLIAGKNTLQPNEAVGAEGLYRPGVERIRTIEVDHFS